MSGRKSTKRSREETSESPPREAENVNETSPRQSGRRSRQSARAAEEAPVFAPDALEPLTITIGVAGGSASTQVPLEVKPSDARGSVARGWQGVFKGLKVPLAEGDVYCCARVSVILPPVA